MADTAFDAAEHYRELVGGFYRELVWELGEHARRRGTAIGAAAVAKRVAQKYGIRDAEVVPLPRWNRAELEGHAEFRWAGEIGPGGPR